MAKTEIAKSSEGAMSRPRDVFGAMRDEMEKMFERSMRLPETIDESKVEAKFDKGVLKVTVARKPEAVKSERKIEIK